MRGRSLVAWIPLLAAAALYLPPIAGAGFVADDAINLKTHAAHGDLLGEWMRPTYAHAGGGAGHIWRPVPATLQHAAALALGREGWVFRSLNVLIHLLNAGLLQLVARRMGASASAAAALALAWTAHAALPEAVCWSSDVYDLAATAALLALTAGLLRGRSPGVYAGIAGIGLLIAALCKESAVAFAPLPALLLALRGDRKGAIGAAIGAGAGAAAYLALHGLVTGQGYGGAAGTPLLWKVQAGLAAASWLVVVPHRALMAHLFDPAELGEMLVGTAILVAWTLGASAMWRRDPAAGRALAAGLLAAGLLLAPVAVGVPFIGVQPVRYAYTPLALGAALAGGALAGLPERRAWIAAALVALVSAPRAALRAPEWRDDATLWAAELEVEPGNPYALGSLGRELVARGRVGEGLALWREGVEAAPSGVRVFDKQQERYRLAQVAFLAGDAAMAEEQTRAFIEESAEQGRGVPGNAWCLLADSLDALGRRAEAMAVEDRCVPAGR